ncbi:MAG: hypothetical protein ACK58T_29345, partial [Phycisphaerae bacterium]
MRYTLQTLVVTLLAVASRRPKAGRFRTGSMERRVEQKQASAGAPARAMVCHAPDASAPAALLEAVLRRAVEVELVA